MGADNELSAIEQHRLALEVRREPRGKRLRLLARAGVIGGLDSDHRVVARVERRGTTR